LKPTYNSISPEGTKTFSFTFDTLGFMSRSIEDLQLLADIFALRDDKPASDIPLKEASIALIKTPMWHRAGPGTVAAIQKAEAILKNSGVKVEEVSLPGEINDGDTLTRIHNIIISREAQVAFLKEYRMDKLNLDPEIQGLVENKEDFTHKELLQALDRLASMRSIIDELAANYSAILTPSVLDEAPLGLGDMGSPAFNTLWTASALLLSVRSFLTNLVQGFHTPCVNVPAFTGAHGMPISVSLVAGRFRDQHLLRISKVLSDVLMAESCWKGKM
jgi:Asp-tRNA(Asn)/Glu-tRNA(Gln) amidotransferase A subunit family amidase